MLSRNPQGDGMLFACIPYASFKPICLLKYPTPPWLYVPPADLASYFTGKVGTIRTEFPLPSTSTSTHPSEFVPTYLAYPPVAKPRSFSHA